MAKAASLLRPGMSNPWPALRSDPRRHIRTSFDLRRLAHARTLTSGGVFARLTALSPFPFSQAALKAIRSPHRLAKHGGLHLMGFGMALSTLSLPTPSRMYSKDPKRIEAYVPKVEGRAVCPLCGGGSPDTWHYSALCPATAEGRELCRTRAAHLLGAVGVGNCVSIPALIDWLRGAVREDLEAGDLELIQEGFSFEKGGVFLRVLLFSNLPDTSAIPVPLDCMNGKQWPFLLCKADEWPGDPGAHRVRILVWPEGLTRQAPTGAPFPVALYYLGSALPPAMRRDHAGKLASLLAVSAYGGATGMSLTWPGESPLPLDTLPMAVTDSILDSWGLLPSAPASAPSDTEYTRSLSWLGLLPSVFPTEVDALLKIIGTKERTGLLEKVAVTILSSQFQSWKVARTLIREALRAHRKAARAPRGSRWTGRGYSPLSFQTSLAGSILSAVARVGAGRAVTKAKMYQECLRKGVPVRLRPLAWLMRDAPLVGEWTPLRPQVAFPEIPGATYAAGGDPAPLPNAWIFEIPVSAPVVVDGPPPASPFSADLSQMEFQRYGEAMEGSLPDLWSDRPDLDIRCLRPGHRVSQKVVDLFCAKLGAGCQPAGDWHIADSNLFTHLHSASPPPRGACVKLAKLVRDKEYILLPCCLSEHWILVLLRSGATGGRPVVHIFNSIPGHLDRALLRTLRGALGKSLPEVSEWPKSWINLRIPCQRQAKGSVDCGVHLMYNAASLAMRFVFGADSGPAFHPDSMRIRAAAIIAAEPGTPNWSFELP